MASSSNPYEHYESPHVEEDDLIDPDDATLDDLDDPLHPQPTHTSTSSTTPLNQTYLTSRIPGEDRRAPTNTIDETVWATLSRDLLAVWSKMREVLYPKYLFGGSMLSSSTSLRSAYENLRGAGISGARDELLGIANRATDVEGILGQAHMSEGLRNWDLWGPLIFVLLLSLGLGLGQGREQRDRVFSGVFAMVWGGMAVVTGQIRLLGGNISFAQSVCIIGYTLFPLVIAALLSALGLPVIARIPVYIFLVAWALAAGVSILGGSGVVKNRVGLAVYPLFVFYVGLGTLCFIS